jgi:hypothetical protein
VKAHEVAAQFDTKPGYRVIQYGDVGIPVWSVAISALAQEPRKLDPVAEFCLKAILRGANSLDDVSGLLGIERSLTANAVTSLIQDECVVVDTGETLSLTKKGRLAQSESAIRRPVELRRNLLYDGWLRRPTYLPEHLLRTPKALRSSGAIELRPFPQRPPTSDELDPLEVQDAINLAVKRDLDDLVILKVKTVERSNRLLVPAVAIVFKGQADGRIRVEFAIDGRLSDIHSEAFAKHGGLEKTGVFRDVSLPPDEIDLGEVLGSASAKRVAKSHEDKDKRTLALARFRLSVAQSKLEEASDENARRQAEESKHSAQQKYEDALRSVESAPVKHLLTYEHPELLERAISHAERRLIIVSPWIRRAVVSGDFVAKLQGALKKGIKIYIGYGIGEEDKNAREVDRDAEKDLLRLAKQHPNFKLKRFGDTHAKVLIKDEDFCVVGSFNWLSFSGDPTRTFREEWSTLVALPDVVSSFAAKVLERFNQQPS